MSQITLIKIGMFTTYANKYYAPLCCGGVPGPPGPPFGYGPVDGIGAPRILKVTPGTGMKDGVRSLLGVGQTSQFAVTIAHYARTLSTVTDASVFRHLFACVL